MSAVVLICIIADPRQAKLGRGGFHVSGWNLSTESNGESPVRQEP